MFKGILICLRPVALLIVVLAIVLGSAPIALAEDTSTPYFSVETITLSDGTQLERMIISGPPTPPPGYELESMRVSPDAPDQTTTVVKLDVPAYNWVFGCSAVSASMVAAYFDRNGLPNIYTGPTNGGVMPMNNGVWPTWTDGAGSNYPNNPLTASHNGVDGRIIKGSIDDYWVAYGSAAADPFITGGWAQHTWGDAVGDYMWTSQSTYNTDGATSFWGYPSATKLTCDDAAASNLDDGSLGRRNFYQARGYSVTECYNQATDNRYAGGFSFEQYKAKIDAGYPVFLNLAGHSIVGVGYDDATRTVYLNDTWNWSSGTYSMPWGGSYSTMQLQSVSIVEPTGLAPTPAISINNVSVTEGASGTVAAEFTVSLSMAAPSPVSVAWATANGTAAAGTDYAAASGTIDFAAGESTQPVTVQVNGDATYESNETFYVNLTNPVGATLADALGLGTIVNDDSLPATLHVGDLDGTKSLQNKTKTWTANVTITVHDASHAIASGAVVTGNWSGGASDTATCTTGRKGTCTVSKSGIPYAASSVTFTVSGVTRSGYTYDSIDNHDVDNGTNGTTITITK